MANIGVNVREVESQGSSVLRPAPLYNIGIFIKSKKGAIGESVLVTSLDSYRTAFGGADLDSYSYYVMKGLFNNLGSSPKPNVYVVREYDTSNPGEASSITIGSGLDYIKFSAGYFGKPSPGLWGDDLRIQIISGITSESWRINIYEQRGNELILVESTPEFTKEDMVDTINSFSKWIMVEAFGDLDNVTITPDLASYKEWEVEYSGSALPVVLDGNNEITDITGFTTADLDITVGSNTIEANLSKAELINILSLSDLQPDGGSGYELSAERFVEIYTNFINTFSTEANPIIANYNSTANNITITSLYAGVDISAVADGGATLFTATDLTLGSNASPGYRSLENGEDPASPSNSQLFDTQIKFFEGKQLQYVMSTDRFDVGWATQLDQWCKLQGDVMGIFQADRNQVPTGNFSEYSSLLVAHSYVAGYFNWGYVPKEVTPGQILIPMIGHVFGAYYVQRKYNFGGYAHIAPGGVDVSILGVNGLQWMDDITPELMTLITRKYGFNVVKFSPGYGYVTESSRTFSTRNKFYSIHIRTSKNFIVQTVKNQMKIYQQRPNNATTRESLGNTARIFLGKQYDTGMFETIGGFENNVAIKCDEENNDLVTRKNRQLVLDLGLNFVEISEEVNINLIQLDGGIQVEER